jgi:hypothetical protein
MVLNFSVFFFFFFFFFYVNKFSVFDAIQCCCLCRLGRGSFIARNVGFAGKKDDYVMYKSIFSFSLMIYLSLSISMIICMSFK